MSDSICRRQAFAYYKVPLFCGLFAFFYGGMTSCRCEEVYLERTPQGKVIAASGPQEMHDVIEALFSPLGRADLEKLKFAPDLTISLQSAWELVRRSALLPAGKHGVASSEEIRHFIGFVEGRLCAPVPSWWTKPVARMKCDSWKAEAAQLGMEADISYFPDFSKVGVHVPKGIGMRQLEEGRIILSGFGKSCTIDDGYLTAAWEEVPVEFANFVFAGDGRICLSFSSHLGGKYPIYCIDTNSGNLEWSTTVWGSVSAGGGTGIAGKDSYVELAVVGDSTLVFGRRIDSAYIEGFAMRDGRPLFRFSTSY